MQKYKKIYRKRCKKIFFAKKWCFSWRETLHQYPFDGLLVAVNPPEAERFLHRVEIPERPVVCGATAFHAYPTRLRKLQRKLSGIGEHFRFDTVHEEERQDDASQGEQPRQRFAREARIVARDRQGRHIDFSFHELESRFSRKVEGETPVSRLK